MNINRLKFDINELVNEILDHVPEEIFIRDDTTFCDPEIGGGQFVKEIEKRLRKYGHSDYNISKRVFGYTTSIIRINYAVNKYKLVGQYGIFNIMIDKTIDGMKFDVIVGNPPFQAPSRNKKANLGSVRNLYQKFIKLSCSIVKNEKSIISLIVPPGFIKSTKWGESNKYFKMLKARGISYIKLEGVKKYFNVTNPVCYFISNKTEKIIIDSKEKIKTNLNDLFFIPSSMDKYTLSIFNKVTECNNSINPNFKRLSKIPQTDYIVIKAMNNRLHGTKATTNLTNLSLGNDLIWEHKYSKNLETIFNSKIFSYLIRRTQYDAIIYFNFFNGLKIPKDVTKEWTNDELYKFYKLSDEEINSVETFGEYYLK